MSELEHALRSALADPPGARPRDTDALYDIELRLTRRRQRRRRAGFGALVVAAVAAIAIPIGLTGPHVSPDSSSSTAGADAGGGRLAAPPTTPTAVRAAAQRAADAAGAQVANPVRWVRTNSSRLWALEPPNHGIKPADRAVYVIALTGRFRCLRCHEIAGVPRTVGSEIIIVPVSTRPGDRAPAATQGRSYDLAKLGEVHTFTLR